MQLYQRDSLNANNYPTDGALIHFDPKLFNEIEQRDAIKPTNQDENFAIVNSGKLFSIESRNIPQNNDTIQLYMNQLRDSSYAFVFDFNQQLGMKTYLLDKFLATKFPIESMGKTQYNFVIQSLNSESKETDRFALVFEDLQTKTLKLANSKISIRHSDFKYPWTNYISKGCNFKSGRFCES